MKRILQFASKLIEQGKNMLAVVTSKGQLTLPKNIRERLGLSVGSRLDFQVDERGWLLARPVTNTALGLAGLLRRPGQKAMSLEAMADAVEQSAVDLNLIAPKPLLRNRKA